MMEIIAYIRSLLPSNKPKRKRCSTEEIDYPATAKFRKISLSPISSLEDPFLSGNSANIYRPRKSMEQGENILRPSWLVKPIINLDDDDDDDGILRGAKKKPNNVTSKIHLTSTPNVSKLNQNGFDDLTFRDYTSNPMKRSGIQKKFDHIKPHSSYFSTVSSMSQNPSFRDRSTFLKSLQQKASFPTISKRSGIGFNSNRIDISFQLDEKRKYKELLSKATNISTNLDIDSFAKYSTPIGKISPRLPRNHKINKLAHKKPVGLTNGESTKSGNSFSKLSIKDTIIKVLDDIDNDVVELKDSDSDVEILPDPPSPKPDIKVDRVNSLKTIANSSESHHDNWISNKIRIHKQEIETRQKLLEAATAQCVQLKDIGNEVRSKQLEDVVNKCLHIKEIVLPVDFSPKLPELTDEQETAVRYAFSKTKSGDEVLVRKFNLNITRRDLQTLNGLNWLNDEVINFYMNLMIERSKSGKYPSVYAFNTFFYPKLLKDGHSSLKRWTKRVDVFAYDMIVIPVHMRMHWCVAIIDFRNKCIGYYDSMGSTNNRCLEALARYLYEEHLDKKKCEYDISDWSKECLKDIPQQMNGSDCGVFACTFAEFLTRNSAISFSQEDMPYLRRKMVVEITEGRLLIN